MIRAKAYIVAARRSANGRLGGMHRNRRLEDLATPVLLQALDDARIEASRVEVLVAGNMTAGNNPARLIALFAGLSDHCVTLTVDRHAASGLEAITNAVGRIASGEADIVAAGGAEAFSTAPWRITKPRTLYHLPRFVGLAQTDNGESGDHATVEAAEALAKRLSIPRNVQDEHTIASHIKAALARDARRLSREIVALRNKPEETRDELVDEPDIDDMEAFPTILGDGTITAGNSSLPADAAAFVVVVSERVYQQLGRPPALVIDATASVGVASSADIEAPIAAARLLAGRKGCPPLVDLDAIELGETSAVQAIAFRSALDLPERIINADGGQIARGQPGGAASAVLAVRLFTRLVCAEELTPGARGAVVIGASGGQALAALFTRV